MILKEDQSKEKDLDNSDADQYQKWDQYAGIRDIIIKRRGVLR